jgi:hypothetical protein
MITTSEYLFGSGNGRVKTRLANRIDRIARKHGACFVSCVLPGDGPRYWFACPNRGNPFDQATEQAVWEDLVAAGLADERGLVLP